MRATCSYVRPVSARRLPDALSALMRTYGLNYILLKHLFADLNPGAAYAVHYPDRCHRLESVLLRRDHYTTTLRLTYSLLGRSRRPLVHPVQLTVRVYHDARQAALLPSPARPPAEDTMAAKYIGNRFLSNVLTLFHRRGVQLVPRGGGDH